MRVGHRTCEKGQPGTDREPAARGARTHCGSEVNRDEEFLLALVSFLWRGIHRRSGPGLREIGAQLSASTQNEPSYVSIVPIVLLWKPGKPGAVRPHKSTASRSACRSLPAIATMSAPQEHQTPVQDAKTTTQEPQMATETSVPVVAPKAES